MIGPTLITRGLTCTDCSRQVFFSLMDETFPPYCEYSANKKYLNNIAYIHLDGSQREMLFDMPRCILQNFLNLSSLTV